MSSYQPPLQEQFLPEDPQPILSMHPKKFAMWLGIVSIIMIFASLTSAHLVRRAEGNWLQFELPPLLLISTALIIASSVSMQWAFFAAKRDNIKALKIALVVTSALGLAFVATQYEAFYQLVDIGVYFVGNPSGSFLIAICGVHVVHLVSGVVVLLLTLIRAFRYKIHSKDLVAIEICTTYWHFLGALWVYLFIFFWYNH
jgi:cytochrome c oxidase subunit III